MFHEQHWLLVFLANLLRDKRKGELAEEMASKIPIGFVV